MSLRAAAAASGGAARWSLHSRTARCLPSSSLEQADATEVTQKLDERYHTGVSLKELSCGRGRPALPGSWVSVHYSARLVGDGTILEDTRSSGRGDRFYGRPLQFEVGELGDAAVLRALHACVLDMREGGERRVRTNVYDPDFGYTKEGAAELVEGRVLQADWLVDVRVHLVDVRPARPPAWERLWERFRSS